jgi:hypothetical protein
MAPSLLQSAASSNAVRRHARHSDALLRRGLTVTSLSPSCGPSALAISSGVRRLADSLAPAVESTDAAAVVPRADWRPLAAAERTMVCSTQPADLSASVFVFDIGAELLGRLQKRLLPLITVPDGDRAATLRRARKAVLELIHDRHEVRAEYPGAVDLVVNRPGQLSTAFDPRSGRFIGLHIDSHQALSLRDRERGMTLLAVNVGFAERYLHFVNLPVTELVDLVLACGEPLPQSAPALKDAFFRNCPDYPVVRIALPPGHGYLCNTQDTIHDGASNDQGLPDVCLLTLNGLAANGPLRRCDTSR